MVVLNSEQMIRDLFEKRSANYSAKPSNFVAEVGHNYNILFRTYVYITSVDSIKLLAADDMHY